MPAEARKGDVFYLKPKTKMPTDPIEPWYQSVPLGKNTLATMMQNMADKGHPDKKLTNHSLRAYAVSKMFKENVPENLIMNRSGHHSAEGVHGYTQETVEQDYQACSLLQNEQVATLNPEEAPQNTVTPTMFQGYSFSNCTIQMSTPQMVLPLPQVLQAPPPIPGYSEDFSHISLEELCDFWFFVLLF